MSAHGVMTAFDGPVVPDVNISEWMSRYSGPSKSGGPAAWNAVAPARNSSRCTTRGRNPRRHVGAVEHDDRVQVGQVVGDCAHRIEELGRDHEHGDVGVGERVGAESGPVNAVFNGTSTARSQPRPSMVRCASG